MTSDKNKSGSSWLTIILVIIIILVFDMFAVEHNKNEQSQQAFAYQTAGAENLRAFYISATSEIEDKIRGCIDINKASLHAETYQCVVGSIVDIEVDKRDPDPSQPTIYFTYFSYIPNEFFIYGDKFLGGYVGDCVAVTGNISILHNGTPYMIATDLSPNFSIESLPDNVCFTKP